MCSWDGGGGIKETGEPSFPPLAFVLPPLPLLPLPGHLLWLALTFLEERIHTTTARVERAERRESAAQNAQMACRVGSAGVEARISIRLALSSPSRENRGVGRGWGGGGGWGGGAGEGKRGGEG